MPESNNPEDFSQYFTWNQVEFFELDQVMRQSDVKFITALRNLALSTMTKDDEDLIKARTVTEDQVPSDALRLFYTNRDASNFNNNKIKNMPGDFYSRKLNADSNVTNTTAVAYVAAYAPQLVAAYCLVTFSNEMSFSSIRG
ncbi:hypothetical protein HCN44_010387 [Aphidius gifuensis]|uniref:Uncharacterized protein n=1 Tax=Aphidius gifuensis TaxID=684658 RepID=A0A834XUP5_APHGI|nr:hypothetical protein HCN44_010387 [Aphidius gifuensis]